MITTGYDYMRVLEDTIGQVRIFSDRPYGYKRYHVDWGDGNATVFHGIWYNLKTVQEIVYENVEVIDSGITTVDLIDTK